jgi:hypothetical protein
MKIIDHMDCDANYIKFWIFKNFIQIPPPCLWNCLGKIFKIQNQIFLLINWSRKGWVTLDEPCVNGIWMVDVTLTC